ncbi:MAG: 3-dehydroquinate synthase [Candidatus Solibacter usitatus]|nr:3-dehydroquinate synthase [Candidatus Solibacter usitatus]
MPVFEVLTPRERYPAIVERGILARAADYLPPKAGRVFVVSTQDVWKHQGEALERALAGTRHEVLFLPGGEDHKRLAPLEALAGQMVERGGDRSSLVIAFGGGIVNDMAGFLAAIFMRGIPVVQIPTTLLAQVDAAIGGKTGVNLAAGKNLIGSFHQPLAVLIDPALLDTLPEREYRAGLFEVLKHGVIRSQELFRVMAERSPEVLARVPDVVDFMIADSVRIKAEVVSADEREGGLRRILNFGHTIGHALEAETAYSRFLHGEAVAFGMQAAVRLAESARHLSPDDSACIRAAIRRYGPLPPLDGIPAESLLRRLGSDKKTVQGKVHFVLPTRIGQVTVVSGIEDALVLNAIRAALA